MPMAELPADVVERAAQAINRAWSSSMPTSASLAWIALTAALGDEYVMVPKHDPTGDTQRLVWAQIERERCAKIAEEFGDYATAKQIADRIRASVGSGQVGS